MLRKAIILTGRSMIWAMCAFVATAGAPRPARAAADLEFREFRLRHVCIGGETPGAVCCAPQGECGTGTCVIDAFGKVSATLTMIVDDDVSEQNDTAVQGRRLKALTLLLETKGRSRALLAQTFQHLNAADLDTFLDGLESGPPDEFGFAATEGLLHEFLVDAANPAAPLDLTWLIHRTIDPETMRRLRVSVGLAPDGPELPVIQPQRLKLDRYQDASAAEDPFASVLRVKLNTYFVAPKDTSCP